VAGHGLTAVGVVMGQGQGSDTSAILAAAAEAAQQLVNSVAPAAGGPTIASPGVGASNQDGHSHLFAPSPPGSN
ncbi:MAG TPA: hypothetical protein VGO16_02035, partial [Pseudonocardiaceae bacterium]|nr:hypothetical protein [Pseudonocardiaceae bacterium]